MIAVLLTILKVIGWVLLSLLALIVLILLVVLLVPVRYHVEAEAGSKLSDLKLYGRATWLLHLISFGIEYKERELCTSGRIAWKKLGEGDDGKPLHAQSENENDKQTVSESHVSSDGHSDITLVDVRDKEAADGDIHDPLDDNWVNADRPDVSEFHEEHQVSTMADDNRDPAVHMVVPHAEEDRAAEAEIRIKDRKRKDKAEKKEEKRAAKELKQQERAAEKEQKQQERAAKKEQKQLEKQTRKEEKAERKEQKNKKREAKKASRKKRKLPDFGHIRAVVRSIGDRREDIMSFLENSAHRKAMAHLWKRLKKTGKKLIPKDYGLSGSAGLTDPYTTGRLAVINSMLFPRIGERVNVEFNYDEPVLDLKGHAKGKIRLGTFVAMILPLLLDRNIWRTIKDAIELKKKLDETSELIKGGKAA